MTKNKKRNPPLKWEEYKKLGYYVTHHPCRTITPGLSAHDVVTIKHATLKEAITWFYFPKNMNAQQQDIYYSKLRFICRQQEQDFGWSTKMKEGHNG